MAGNAPTVHPVIEVQHHVQCGKEVADIFER